MIFSLKKFSLVKEDSFFILMKHPFPVIYVSVTKNNIKLVNLIKRHLMNDCRELFMQADSFFYVTMTLQSKASKKKKKRANTNKIIQLPAFSQLWLCAIPRCGNPNVVGVIIVVVVIVVTIVTVVVIVSL